MKPDEYLTISEFARIVGVTPTSLRVYDSKGAWTTSHAPNLTIMRSPGKLCGCSNRTCPPTRFQAGL
jgi:hypothetical protein